MPRYSRAELCGSSYLQILTLVSLGRDGHQMELEILMIWDVKSTFTFQNAGNLWPRGELCLDKASKQTKCLCYQAKRDEVMHTWPGCRHSYFPENPLVFQQLLLQNFFSSKILSGAASKSCLASKSSLLEKNQTQASHLAHPELRIHFWSKLSVASSSLSWKSKCQSRLADKDSDICHQKIGHKLQNYFICNERTLCYQN